MNKINIEFEPGKGYKAIVDIKDGGCFVLQGIHDPKTHGEVPESNPEAMYSAWLHIANMLTSSIHVEALKQLGRIK